MIVIIIIEPEGVGCNTVQYVQVIGLETRAD